MAQLDRRDFLKLVGVGAGGAATGCYRASELPEQLIPYVVQPEEVTPGLAIFYASTCTECSAGCGLHVRVREGRPVKLEGNPDHPINQGALCARGQAGIGRSYSPDRIQKPQQRQSDGSYQPLSWEDATQLLAAKVRAAGSKTRVFGGRVGPTLSGLIDQWIAAVGAGARLVYEPFGYEALAAASREVFGVDGEPTFDLRDTDYVIDFGGDFLDAGRSPVEHQRQLKAAREVLSEGGKRARLVYVGPRQSTTTSNADTWIAARPGTEGLVALGIAKVVFDARQSAGRATGGDAALIASVLGRFDAATVAKASGVSAEQIQRIGSEFAAAERAVALPPGPALSSRRAVAANGAVLLLNAVVGAVGRNVSMSRRPESEHPTATLLEVVSLIEAAKKGDVSVLLVHDSNPLYSLPGPVHFAEALEKVDFVVSFASIWDETSKQADLILPDHTPLESWGDAAPRAGVRSLIQPSLRPLYDTQALGDTLLETARALGASGLPDGSFRGVVEAEWSGGNWRKALARGGEWNALAPSGASVAQSVANLRFEAPELQGSGDFVLLANPSPLLFDGRGANLPWLQETPDPVTKVAWQSWAEISSAAAEKMGIHEGDVVSVQTTIGAVELPVFPRGGLRDDVVAIAVGQGHTVGSFASADGSARGVSVISILPALTDESGGRAWLTAAASVTPTGAHRRLPNAQRDDNKRGRQLGEAITLAAFAEGKWNADAFVAAGAADGAGPGGGHEDGKFHEMLKPYEAKNDSTAESEYRWGMTIDLDSCSGCSACVVACAIENNIPNVGEEGMLRNRGMQWLRIERFVGDGDQELIVGRKPTYNHEKLEDTDVRHSPMLCQQCGAAPCEPVCPVLATYHNEEGLNGMIYNRCIGTRYCSNNCPYKVRRYNWFDYAIERLPEPSRLMLNPDVTVRSQGVMEKCTFCIQRVQGARQLAKDEFRPIADGEVTPACAQSCPSQAISFGNLKDDKSQVVKRADENRGRAYHALHMLNTRPGITYLAKLIRGEEKHG